jgi:hypothetical protein
VLAAKNFPEIQRNTENFKWQALVSQKFEIGTLELLKLLPMLLPLV